MTPPIVAKKKNILKSFTTYLRQFYMRAGACVHWSFLCNYLKLSYMSFCGYLSDQFNVFDGTIVLISLLDLIGEQAGGLSSLRALRLFRVLRILRVIGKLDGLRVLLGALANAAGDVMYLLVVPLLFVFMVN